MKSSKSIFIGILFTQILQLVKCSSWDDDFDDKWDRMRDKFDDSFKDFDKNFGKSWDNNKFNENHFKDHSDDFDEFRTFVQGAVIFVVVFVLIIICCRCCQKRNAGAIYSTPIVVTSETHPPNQIITPVSQINTVQTAVPSYPVSYPNPAPYPIAPYKSQDQVPLPSVDPPSYNDAMSQQQLPYNPYYKN